MFFIDVRVPQSGRVGAEGDGWTVAKQLLKHERGGPALSPALRRRLEIVRTMAARTPSGYSGTLADDPAFQWELGEAEAELASYEHFEKLAMSGHPVTKDAAYGSLNKVMSSELAQRISVLMTWVAGIDALPDQRDALIVGSGTDPLDDDQPLVAMPYYLNSRATTIYAGTSFTAEQIQLCESVSGTCGATTTSRLVRPWSTPTRAGPRRSGKAWVNSN